MRQLLIATNLLICNLAFSQITLHLPAAFRDSNYLNIRMAEPLKESRSYSDYIFNGKDSNCKVMTYYYNVSVTATHTTTGKINILICKIDSAFNITVDVNNNKNFNDDSTAVLFADHISNKYQFEIKPPGDSVPDSIPPLYLEIVLVNIKTKESNGQIHSNTSFQLVHKNSIFATFLMGNSLYEVEAIPKYLNNGTGTATIGFSEPNEKIKKMDVSQNIIPHRLINDTVISGSYKFIIDSVDFIHNIISLTAWPLTNNDYGYKISNRIRNYSLAYLRNTNKKIFLSSLFKKSDYLLIDFWGSWCEPCLKNIPRLKALNERSENLNLSIIGIAYERINSPSNALIILNNLHIQYDNFYINSNLKSDSEILNDLDIFAYPTYILLNKNLRIVMRETNEQGLEKIEKFLESKNR